MSTKGVKKSSEGKKKIKKKKIKSEANITPRKKKKSKSKDSNASKPISHSKLYQISQIHSIETQKALALIPYKKVIPRKN